MKNTRRGFIVPLLLVIIAVLIVGGGAYVFTQNKEASPVVSGNVELSQATSTKISDTQNTPVVPNEVVPSVAQKVEAPTISSASPSSGPVETIVTLHGFFPSGTSVTFGKEIVGQTVIDMDSFSFVIPDSLEVRNTPLMGAPSISVSPRKYMISLTNGPQSIGNSFEFTVTPTPIPAVSASLPIVTSISSSQITAGVTTNITMRGSNFRTTNMIAIVGSGSVTSVGPTQVSADGTSITFSFPKTLTVPALYNVGVYDRGGVQGYVQGGQSLLNSSITITLVDPHASIITSINPVVATIGSIVTISGSNFYGDSKVNVATYLPSVASFGPIIPSSYTSTLLSLVVPSSMSPGKYVITVSGSAGHISNPITLTVVAQ